MREHKPVESFSICKFGGSSVGSPIKMKECADSMLNTSHCASLNLSTTRKVAVISAIGKTTNQLEQIAFMAHSLEAKALEKAQELFQDLFNFHRYFATELTLDLETPHIKTFFLNLKEEGQSTINEIHKQKNAPLSPFLLASLCSLGERLSSFLFSQIHPSFSFFSIETILKTNPIPSPLEATPFFVGPQEDMALEIKKKIASSQILITQGFIAKDKSGRWNTLGREGSDYTATLLASFLEANLVEIFTDVEGIFSADPRIFSWGVFLPELSYKEATLLAELGAKVLFSKTLHPVVEKEIPVWVGTLCPKKHTGTLITNSKQNHFQAEIPLATVDFLVTKNPISQKITFHQGPQFFSQAVSQGEMPYAQLALKNVKFFNSFSHYKETRIFENFSLYLNSAENIKDLIKILSPSSQAAMLSS